MPITLETVGIHPSTGLCLEALQWLQEHENFTNILDMGCGNGILSVVAANLWDAHVLSADISENALADARINIAANGLESRIQLVRSDGFLASEIALGAPFDLLLFNMLAQSTVEMAPQVAKCMAPGGIVILAGILAWMAEDVRAAYTCLGFEIVKESSNSPWQCYVLRYHPVTKKESLS